MDPFAVLVTATRIGLLILFCGILAWAAHQRAVVHDFLREWLRTTRTNLVAFPGWVTAGTVAGLV